MRLSLIGIIIRATLSLPRAYALGALLFGLQIADLAAFVGICALLATVAIAAAYLPARLAAQLDPVVVLRME
jgi:ABC-type lipoprotein release transport system permease subunit